MYRNLLIFILALLPAVIMAGRDVADIPNVHVADRTRYVSNPDGVLSPAAVDSLDAVLARVWAETSAEPVVVAVASMPEDTDIDSYATEIFEQWGIGKKDKDNGVLMVIARDDRKAVIRTGYGAEGVLPDIVCGRILRGEMFPRFKQGDYDAGTLAGVNAMARVLTDPKYADELRSFQSNDAIAPDFDGDEIFKGYLAVAAVVAVGMMVWVLSVVWISRRRDPVSRYSLILPALLGSAVASCLTLGMALPALIVAWLVRRRIRGHRRCPNCGTAMRKIDEENDNAYLTPAQDTEERINSVDYDVWVCPNCRETDILPYVNRAKNYRVCNNCGSRASSLVANRVLLQPTTARRGRGERIYHCRNCGHNHHELYYLPVIAAAPVIIGGGGGHGGGGFSGGSFGGGLTGGGGASGGW